MITIERLTTYNGQDAADLGQLLAHLNTDHDGTPVPQEWLEKVIGSSFHDQIVARNDGKIVGAATLSIILHPTQDQIGYLESLVVDPDTRGQGVGDLLWQEIDKWCREKGVKLEFTSRPSREAAHRFYLKHGATIRETTVFGYKPAE